MPPSTHDQFIGVFAAYNEAVWPVQVIAYLAAVMVLVAIALRRPWSIGDRQTPAVRFF